MVDVNVLGSITGALMAHDHLARSAAPVLLNLCSASALYGQASLATYGATKSAVKSLTEALDLEWADEGIRVRSLMPLFVDTDMVSGDMLRLASVRRLGVRLTPDDVAEKAWRVVQERPNPVRGPHRAVGVQTQILAGQCQKGRLPNAAGHHHQMLVRLRHKTIAQRAPGFQHVPGRGPYREVLERGKRYLLSVQDDKTGFFKGRMYEQGLSTLALAEMYGMDLAEVKRTLGSA